MKLHFLFASLVRCYKLFLAVFLLFGAQGVHATLHDWSTALSGGVNITSFDAANTESGVGYFGDLVQRAYFSDHVGVFFGAQLVRRVLNFQDLAVGVAVDSSAAANFVEIPAGLSFQYGAWGSGVGNADLGVTYGLPLSDYDLNGAVYEAKSHLNLFFGFSNVFPVTKTFYMGFKLAYKYALADGVEDLVGSGSKSRDFMVGIVGQFGY